MELISLNFARKGALLLKSFGEDGFPPLSCLHQKNLTILVTNLPLLDRIWYIKGAHPIVPDPVVEGAET